jgi:hypothetical protein
MKLVYRLLCALQVFVGIGAVPGGLAAILNPQNPLGVPVESLRHSPFSDYLIPGIILFVVIGLGNLGSALFFLRRSRYQGYVSSVFGWALVIWIVVQCIMLQSVGYLHVIYLIIGLLETALAMALIWEQQLWPANLIERAREGK